MSAFEHCIHRGRRILDKHHVCETCGRRGQVAYIFACALHGECVLRPWTPQKSKITETCCVTCPDLTLADGTQPAQSLRR